MTANNERQEVIMNGRDNQSAVMAYLYQALQWSMQLSQQLKHIHSLKETIYSNDHAAFLQSSLFSAIVRLDQSCYVYQIQTVHHYENNSLCEMVTVSAAPRVKGTLLCVCICGRNYFVKNIFFPAVYI